jgi:hypothetical protein
MQDASDLIPMLTGGFMKQSIWLLGVPTVLMIAGCSPSSSVEGQNNRKLTLVRPSGVSVERGGVSKADIVISRENLSEDVSIRFSNLPRGVEIVEPDSRIVGVRGTYTLRASDDADLVKDHSATVTASGGPGGISVSEPINISVTAKK